LPVADRPSRGNGVTVEIFSPLEKIAVDETAIDKATLAPIDSQLAVALGLAMRKDKERRP